MKTIICTLILFTSAVAFPNKSITIHPSRDTRGILHKENIERALTNGDAATRIMLSTGVFYINEGIVI